MKIILYDIGEKVGRCTNGDGSEIPNKRQMESNALYISSG